MGNTYANDPYFRSPTSWERHTGHDMYQRKTYCPYCGKYKRDEITMYDCLWRTLKCGRCGKTYRVK